MESTSLSPKPSPRITAREQHGCSYLAPAASTTDIMREQMEYLAAHAGKACQPACPACRRFDQLKLLLLQPFH